MDQRLRRYRLGKKIGWEDLENTFSDSEKKKRKCVKYKLCNRLIRSITNLLLNAYFKECKEIKDNLKTLF